MSKDGPPSGRIIFGPRREKSMAALNLRKLLAERPHLQEKADEMTKQGSRADIILKHFRESGDAEQFYVAFYRGEYADKFVRDRYSDDLAALRDEIRSSLSLKLYTGALLMMYDKIRTEWLEVKSVPKLVNSKRNNQPKP
ncbi:hypothetical protein [Acidocella sp.]|uniref:hypothetical protein n=1 Tax=Acidocella sp. TaxID=50710 RepID=UPI0017CE179A|nr:hypothetical protein [Acidocella sp.]NNM56431.1 hypothetical protein [Acidocella sp.]